MGTEERPHQTQPALPFRLIREEMLLGALPVGTRSALHVPLELGGIKTRFFLLAHDRKLVDDPALSTPVNRRARSLRDTLAHQLMAGFTAQPADGVIHIRR